MSQQRVEIFCTFSGNVHCSSWLIAFRTCQGGRKPQRKRRDERVSQISLSVSSQCNTGSCQYATVEDTVAMSLVFIFLFNVPFFFLNDHVMIKVLN